MPHMVRRAVFFISCHQCARGRVLVTYWPMSQSLPVLRGAALGQCCRSLVVINDVMGRLSLLQSHFSLLGAAAPDAPANGAARILAGAWSDLHDVRNLLSRLAGQEVDHV